MYMRGGVAKAEIKCHTQCVEHSQRPKGHRGGSVKIGG
jgi:hypothetical protein